MAAASLAVIVLWQHGGGWLKTARVPVIGPILPFGSKLSSVPGSIVALTLATAAVAAFDLPVETIGTRFGGIPAALPAFALPDFSWGTARYMLMPAITLALLGSIESLLCARVADGMIDDVPSMTPTEIAEIESVRTLAEGLRMPCSFAQLTASTKTT